ncbi:MAG: chromate efflux transporter, partial [Alphaproteobacteria bacterium]|nr:chromate efflux transporter [Alphaproteobacteria bacterium]
MTNSAPDNVPLLSPWRIFIAFLALGVTAFGGPVAHIGYFRTEFVERRKWIDADQFQDLIALCQFLPGPMSTQIGIAIGMLRGRVVGGLAAWFGFTAPSAILMIGLGVSTNLFDSGLPDSLVHGLKLAAVAIVAWALWLMGRTACTSVTKMALAVAACIIMLFTNLVWIQIGVIAGAALAGHLLIKPEAATGSTGAVVSFSRTFAMVSAGILGGALIVLPIVAAFVDVAELDVFSSFFRVGSLVFGGGHVVLPLLQTEVVPPGWVDGDTFLAGYGAAQALPGPMFAFAGYLGAVATPGAAGPGGWLVGLIALFAIFAPSFLILTAALPYWQSLRSKPALRTALAGVN